METPGSARRARKAHKRRQDVLDAAARVFARNGFERATTREIALEADVSEGTIYTYFASKQQLLTELASGFQVQLGAIIPEMAPDGDVRDIIQQAVERVLSVIAEDAVVVRALLTAVWDHGYGFHGYLLPGTQKLITQVEQFLNARIAVGAMKACDVHTVARMVMGMVIYVAAPYVQEIEPSPSAAERREQARLLVDILFDGLRV